MIARWLKQHEQCEIRIIKSHTGLLPRLAVVLTVHGEQGSTKQWSMGRTLLDAFTRAKHSNSVSELGQNVTVEV